MNVCCVQFDIVWEDKPANHAIIESMLDEADVQPGTFVLLPELGDTGFSFNLERIVDPDPTEPDASLAWAARLARRRRIWVQVGYAERGDDERGRNCATLIDPKGRATGTYRKVYPFSYGREIEYFTGGDDLVVRPVDGVMLCPTVCYDLRFPELWRIGAVNGAEVFTIGASWPAPRQAHWRALLIARAIENQAYVVAVNRVGRDPHLAYAGGSIVVSPQGEVLAEADDQPQVLEAHLDIESLRDWRRTFPALRDIRPELLGQFPIDQPTVESGG
jgi:omega-amidase